MPPSPKTESRPPRLRLSFGVQINFILCLGLAILIAVGVLAHRNIDVLVDTGRIEASSIEDLRELERVLGSLGRAESAQRAYLITGSEEDFAGYRSARSQAMSDLRRLRDRPGNLDQGRALRELETLVFERIDRLDRVVQVRKSEGLAASTAMLKAPQGKDLNERIQVLAEQLRKAEIHALGWQRADTAFSADTTSYLIFWATAFEVSLLLWAMIVIHRHRSRSLAAERAVRASEAQLRLITDAVPALIGYVDRSGRLQFHNRAFEKWLGRTASELREHTLEELLGEQAYGALVQHVARVLEGSDVECNFSLTRTDARTMHLSAQLVPRRSENGEVSGYYILVTDITALNEVNRMKSEFVSTVSHELRTPLTSIRGSLGLVAGGVAGALNDKTRELVAIALENCERLLRLVNDILDSERMASGKMQFAMEVFDLAGVIERSIRETGGFASAHGVRVQFQAAAGPCTVRADRDRLVQVVTNLISNACKFSSREGLVEVWMETPAEMVKVVVNDRGSGVPSEFQARLFERFSQSDSSDRRRLGGTGLGLSICKGILERLGGRIGYASRQGGGSSFFFELPVWPESGEAP
jgi:PAS domain S-box-containing protein